MLPSLRPDPNEIREATVRNALVAIRARSDANLLGAITLLIALRKRLLGFPEVLAITAEGSRPPVDARRLLEKPDLTAFLLLERDVIDIAKGAEEANIPIDISNSWEEAALKL